jgi:uncharacterized membrane protein YjjP (DUF1212 family)
MSTAQQNLEAIQDIRRMMERSSRFISLSGWSGVAAGSCALIGAWFAQQRMNSYFSDYSAESSCSTCLRDDLLAIAGGVLFCAVITAFLFTWMKSKKDGVQLWGTTSRRLVWNTLLPMIAGGFIILRMVDLKHYDLLAGTCLVIYGLALINGSKYTLGEIRYLGYAELLTGIISLWIPRYGIYFWAFGFGILHIVYGLTMWLKYDNKKEVPGAAA